MPFDDSVAGVTVPLELMSTAALAGLRTDILDYIDGAGACSPYSRLFPKDTLPFLSIKHISMVGSCVRSIGALIVG